MCPLSCRVPDRQLIDRFWSLCQPDGLDGRSERGSRRGSRVRCQIRNLRSSGRYNTNQSRRFA